MVFISRGQVATRKGLLVNKKPFLFTRNALVATFKAGLVARKTSPKRRAHAVFTSLQCGSRRIHQLREGRAYHEALYSLTPGERE